MRYMLTFIDDIGVDILGYYNSHEEAEKAKLEKQKKYPHGSYEILKY